MNKVDNEAILKMINKRIDDLAQSYKILNDNHNDLEIGLTELRIEWKTTKSWVKWLFGTSLAGTIVSIITVLKTFGVL